MKTTAIIIGTILLLAGLGTITLIANCEDDWCFIFEYQRIQAVDSFERCAELGFPVMESYPRQCRAGAKHFTENIEADQNDLIRVTSPTPGTTIKSPVVVKGEARGNWYFEASFPIKIVDDEGNQLGVGIAEAQSDWMTTDFVPFEAAISFVTSTTTTGKIILEKDNPSGLPEHAASITIPIQFTQTAPVVSGRGTLRGTMTIGPICPVEREGQVCQPTAEMFAARPVFVFKLDGVTLIEKLIPDATGKFETTLPAGDYIVNVMSQGGIGGATGVPTTARIRPGAPVTVNINIDTGIR